MHMQCSAFWVGSFEKYFLLVCLVWVGFDFFFLVWFVDVGFGFCVVGFLVFLS